MRLGVIADIHGNHVALRSVLTDADWLPLEDDGDARAVTRRSVPLDVDAVAGDLARRRHPNAEFVTSVLTGQREHVRAPSSA